MKRILASFVLILSAFILAFSSSGIVNAAPFSRDRWHGYFKNQPDDYGPNLIDGGIHTTNINDFVGFYSWHLHKGSQQTKVSAAYTILDMLGYNAGTPMQTAYDRFADWERAVRWYDANGRINFNTPFSFSANTYYQDDVFEGDVAWYADSATLPSIVFYNPNGTTYAIKRDCANPVGDTAGLYIPPPNYPPEGGFNADAAVECRPDGILIRGWVRDPNYDAGTWVDAIVDQQRNGSNNPPFYNDFADHVAGDGGVHRYEIKLPSTYVDGQVHTVYMYAVDLLPPNGAWGSNRTEIARRTIGPCYNYAVEPYIQRTDSTDNFVEQGETVTFQHSMTVTGTTGTKPSTGWTGKSRNIPVNAPQYARDNSEGRPTDVRTGGPSAFTQGTHILWSETVNTTAIPVGQKICRSTSVKPMSSVSGSVLNSAELCVIIAKRPAVHMDGSDVWLGGSFPSVNANCNVASSSARTTASSKAKYAITASGGVNGLQSNDGGASKLIFANGPPAGSFGQSKHCLTDFAQSGIAAVPQGPLGGPVNLSGFATGVYSFNGDVSINPSTISNQITVIVAGNITIEGDIKYTNGSHNGISNLPQLILIAQKNTGGTGGNITLRNGVAQIDGVYIAQGHGTGISQGGAFRTCEDRPANEASCNVQLKVNGAVIANSLSLRRTGGNRLAPLDTAKYAESFDLREDVLLSNYGAAQGSAQARTVHEIELPPRY
jgi:hypothetical protein